MRQLAKVALVWAVVALLLVDSATACRLFGRWRRSRCCEPCQPVCCPPPCGSAEAGEKSAPKNAPVETMKPMEAPMLPADEPPMDPAPKDPAPMDPAPMDPAPMDPAPMDPPPMDPAPMDPPPMDPADPAPMDPAPMDPKPEEGSVDDLFPADKPADAPMEEMPAEDAPPADAPVEEAPPADAPAEEAPPADAPAEEAAPADAPAEEAAPADAPAEEMPPVEEAPAEEPMADAPAEEAPAEEAAPDAAAEEAPMVEADMVGDTRPAPRRPVDDDVPAEKEFPTVPELFPEDAESTPKELKAQPVSQIYGGETPVVAAQKKDGDKAKPKDDLFAPRGDAKDAAEDVKSIEPPVEGAAKPAAPTPRAADARKLPIAVDGPVRAWRDDTGYYATRGRLVTILDGKVRILKTTGKHTTVPLDRLSHADLAYVGQEADAVGIKLTAAKPVEKK